jgi:hypothetical protein
MTEARSEAKWNGAKQRRGARSPAAEARRKRAALAQHSCIRLASMLRHRAAEVLIEHRSMRNKEPLASLVAASLLGRCLLTSVVVC